MGVFLEYLFCLALANVVWGCCHVKEDKHSKIWKAVSPSLVECSFVPTPGLILLQFSNYFTVFSLIKVEAKNIALIKNVTII